MTVASDKFLADAEELVQNRIGFYHDTLNERLALKDRWITDRFDDNDKRITEVKEFLVNEDAALEKLIISMLTSEHQWTEQRVQQNMKRFDDYIVASREREDRAMRSHMDLHEIKEKSQEDFKELVEEKIEHLVKVLDSIREERVLYVTRDSAEAKIDAVEKATTILEKSLVDKIETTGIQLEDKLMVLIKANTERLQKQENYLQVANAKNQQSIIALGILLTLTEVIIRFLN